ncbi:hypothetical protein AALP_AA4G199600 [Arabis alpina]|uniref:Mitochondrial glycoprotein family protein n=1 Tax=Arabis alpina TaxID=50452 RepID=A0A087H4E9_ARAAL|nr:hypothetical protein AALP_AA4G199600 [Arabis alpina]
MRKMNAILKQGRKLVEDNTLLKILQSEISHEISNPRFQNVETGSLGDFKVDWDSPVNRDVVLKRRFDSGEEVVVSALLRQEPIKEEDVLAFPREALAKVCIKKPGISSVMLFDCQVFETKRGNSDFDIERARFIRSLVSPPRSSRYGEEEFYRSLDYKLQDAMKEYIRSKGFSEGLTNFLLCHLNKKEQDQYVNWLRKLESTMSNSLKP